MSFSIKTTIPSWIKENLSMIVLVPTILGGAWQLAELAIVGIPYIRFFSVTQLIPDGLLILIFLSVLFLVSWLAVRMTKEADKTEKKRKPSYFGVLIGVIFWIYISWHVLLIVLGSLNSSSEKKPLFFAIATITGTFILATIYVLVLETLKLVGRKVNTRHPLIQSFRYVTTTIIIISISIIGVYSIKAIRDFSLFSEDFSNLEKIMCKMQNSKKATDSSNVIDPVDKKTYSFKIIYFNDKYLFIKTTESSIGGISKAFIEVLKFEDLMNNEACK